MIIYYLGSVPLILLRSKVLTEYAYQLKSHHAYMATKTRIQNQMRQAANADCLLAQKLLRFVIAGCGFTGVEVAANLAEYIQALKKQYAILRNVHPTIYLINSKDELLPGLNKGLSPYAKIYRKNFAQVWHCNNE